MSLRDLINSARDRSEKEKLGAGVAIWSKTPHVVTKGLDLGQPDAMHANVFHFTGRGWKNELDEFVSGLTLDDLKSCVAVQYSNSDELHPWQSAPLNEIHRQIIGHWFQQMLDEERLISHYQPIYCLRTCRVTGFEALARGVETTGVKSGYELVKAAQEIDQIEAFDQHARIAALRSLSRPLEDHESLFINLTPACFQDGCASLESTIFAARALGISPKKIVFEFVEAERFPGEQAVLKLVECIRDCGARIALDDFGSGHSTIEMAELIMPDIIKFDRSLLKLHADTVKENILRTLVEFAHSIGTTTIAEGIESLPQVALAQRCGFDAIQGWLIGKPHARLQEVNLNLQMSLTEG
ncbi:MAG: EAL domain-containing protein [Fimbriimonadaceae bacterium]|nr:EAL domain-containing protein [Fimbriimonadaceae bacterium]